MYLHVWKVYWVLETYEDHFTYFALLYHKNRYGGSAENFENNLHL